MPIGQHRPANAETEPSPPARKTLLRGAFLATCKPATRRIHQPIVDPARVKGHLNPAGLGQARLASKAGSFGQSSVSFESLSAYAAADESGEAPYGGAEYGIVQSPEADAVCRKLAALHGAPGAIICPSGLSAVSTTIDAFAPTAILLPENVYYPAYRYMRERSRADLVTYAAGASVADIGALLEATAERHGTQHVLLYVEAPGSGTFEIPDLGGIVALARRSGVRTAMDNTWASHARFKPIENGIDIAIQATTKYEGGYGDTPGGVVLARTEPDLAALRRQLRISGNGAVSPQTCTRLFHRLDTLEARLARHEASAAALMRWFEAQDAWRPQGGSPYARHARRHASRLRWCWHRAGPSAPGSAGRPCRPAGRAGAGPPPCSVRR
ncbi:Cys/Met metabolism PLP-dependent enzyme [Enterovirga rhinocerotis]|uniref:Cys/Met metabolism PLP-dependent enzyme n=1 Tax=Enterovirga rhinocerotis TaxID=1339210 RepID=A0A4V3DWL3_9HYPH|nr:Cys/Met metabolism PLP-dependent enzyme [Enterovirga rhinocerotis]